MTRARLLIFIAGAALPVALSGVACGGDASLGRNNETLNPIESSGGSSAGTSSAGTSNAGTGGSGSSNGSSGSGTGSSGSGNGGSGSGGSSGSGNGSGGSDGTACEEVQCVRAIECVETCGGPVLKSSCCPCDSGTFDNISCGGVGPNLDELNTNCGPDDSCSPGLTPVKFYGVAGMAGPEFCWCTIPCESDPNVCPDPTICTTIADGPGSVCADF